MGKIYDNWGRLVESVMHRELLRKLSLQSEPSSTRSFDSDFSSSSSTYDDEYLTPSPTPLHPDALRFKLTQIAKDRRPEISAKVPTRRTSPWKGLFIFSGLLSSKKKNGKEERIPKWINGQRTFHGHEPQKSTSLTCNSEVENEVNRKSELERLQEMNTLKGHLEALVRLKGLDGDSFNHYYTV